MSLKSDVERLGKIAQQNREGRAQDEKRGKAYRERLKEVQGAPQYASLGFWCYECRRDFDAVGLKQTRAMSTEPIAWYGALCPKGHVSIRRITDKINDPYFRDSEYIRRQQGEHEDDFLTPADPRFRYKYPIQWARIQEEKRRREEAGEAITA